MNIASTTHRNSLRRKLFQSHLLVALFCFAILIAALGSSLWLGKQSKQLATAADPGEHIMLQQIHGAVEESTSLTFQYVAMPDDTYRQRWWALWETKLWPTLKQLKQSNTANRPHLTELIENLTALLTRLEVEQWQILEVRNKLGNQRARAIMDNYAQDIENNIHKGLDTLLERETEDGTTIDTLKRLADLRAAFIRTSGSLHRFVNNASPALETAITDQQNIFIRTLNTLFNSTAPTAPRTELLQWLEREFILYAHYSDAAVAARDSEQWNAALYLLNNEVIPLTDSAYDLISETVRHNAGRISQSSATVFSLSELNFTLSILFLLAMLLVAWFSARHRAARIMAPIEQLVNATRQLATEQRLVPLPVQDDDELGALTESFNQMQRSLLQKQAALHQLASTDPLTKLANRRVFTEAIEREWKRCLRNKQALSVIMVDVDYFKQFNDRFGHQAGDHALCAIADVLRDNLHRPYDLAARYGGEEFIIILPDTEPAGACNIANQISTGITALHINAPATTNTDYLSVSCGVSTCHPNSDLEWEALIKSADHALYRAKSRGRNCVCEAVYAEHSEVPSGCNSLGFFV